MIKKIDVHCHVTNRPIRHAVYPDATINGIREHAYRHNVIKTILLASYFPSKGTGVSNYRVKHWIDSESIRPFSMFGSLDFETYFYQGLNELEELKSYIKGIKIYTGYQNIDLSSEKFEKVLNLARNSHLPVMFHTGFNGPSRGSGERLMYLNILEDVVARNSDINFIFSHMGNPNVNDLMRIMRKCPNVFTDMGGLVNSKSDKDHVPAALEMLKKFVNKMGCSRLLFATDFPLQTHEDSIYFIDEACGSVKDRELVYYKNAAELLKIKDI